MLVSKIRNTMGAKPTLPTKTLRTLRDDAERLAKEYKDAAELERKYAAAKQAAKDGLMEILSSDLADPTSNGRMLQAHTLSISYTTRRRQPVVDVALMKKLLSPKLYESLITKETVITVDHDALADAIKSKRIPRNIAKRFIKDGEEAGNAIKITEITPE